MRPMRAVFLLLGFFNASVFATDLKPGLWETRIDQRSESGRIEQENERMVQSLKALPPDVIKRMNAGGLSWDKGVIRTRMCVTPEHLRMLEDADEKAGPWPEGAVNCQTLSETQSSTEHKRVVLCEGPLLEYQEVSKLEQFTGRLVGHTSISWHEDVVDGQPTIRQVETRTRFVATSCGNVRPLPAERFRESLR